MTASSVDSNIYLPDTRQHCKCHSPPPWCRFIWDNGIDVFNAEEHEMRDDGNESIFCDSSGDSISP